jgi:hypothetical protein
VTRCERGGVPLVDVLGLAGKQGRLLLDAVTEVKSAGRTTAVLLRADERADSLLDCGRNLGSLKRVSACLPQ